MGYTQPQPAIPMVSGSWWAMVLRRIAAVLFGLAVLLWPGMTLLVLLVVFVVYALVDGLFAIVAGLVVLFWPGETALVHPNPCASGIHV